MLHSPDSASCGEVPRAAKAVPPPVRQGGPDADEKRSELRDREQRLLSGYEHLAEPCELGHGEGERVRRRLRLVKRNKPVCGLGVPGHTRGRILRLLVSWPRIPPGATSPRRPQRRSR